MATPYDANNTGGTLPLPRIHIPTWFTINSVSQYNDARLDLDDLDELNLLHPTISGTLKDWLYGDNLNYMSEYIGALQENNLYAHHYINGVFLYVIDNNQVVRYGFQVNYEGWINYDASTSSYDPITINGEVAKKEISKEWFFDVSTNYYVPLSSTDVRNILRQIWDYVKQEDFEHFDTVEEVYLFWESLFDDNCPSEEYVQNTIIENSEAKIALNNEELILYGLSPMGDIDDAVINLGDSSTSNKEYDLFYIIDGQTRFSQTFRGYYKENGTITGSYTGQWTCTFLDYSSSAFAYRLYFIVDVSAINKLYVGNKKTIINKSPLKIISPEKLLDYIIKESSFSSFDINAYSSRNALLTAVSNNLPTGISADVMKNEEYFDDQSLLLAFGDRLQEEITIGNIVPKLGSIIAYSDATDQEFLPDTNSSHILYFKNAELKSFNFAVQNNTVIDRIEKLYRYAGLGTNLTTELENINNDPNFKNMKIKEGTAEVLENIQTLFLTEGSVVTSV